MISFEEAYGELTDKEKELFSDTVNLLLGKTYLVYERVEDRRHYRFVEKHMELFQSYLELANWSVHLMKQYGVVQLYNMEERNRRTFTLQETIFLFILRLLYDEKKKTLNLTGNIAVTGQEIQEKYLALQIKNKLPAREVMQRVLKLFASFSLLELKKGHWRDPEAVYALYPSMLMVLDTGDLESLAQWLKERVAAEGEAFDEVIAGLAEELDDFEEEEDGDDDDDDDSGKSDDYEENEFDDEFDEDKDGED